MKQNTLGYKVKQYLMFAGPGTVLFVCVVIVPFVYGLYLTLTSWDGTSPTKDFVGLQNFATAFSADYNYTRMLVNTLRFTLNFDFVSANKNEIKQQGRLK